MAHHRHTTDLAGLCIICFGEGFMKAATLSKEIIDQFVGSVGTLKQEMDTAHSNMGEMLQGLKDGTLESDDSGAPVTSAPLEPCGYPGCQHPNEPYEHPIHGDSSNKAEDHGWNAAHPDTLFDSDPKGKPEGWLEAHDAT